MAEGPFQEVLVAGHAAGAQLRALLLEGSDLSPANAPFLAQAVRMQGQQGWPSTEDQGM